MLKRTLKSQSGFSLVELMVVVAIIGVLAAMSAGQVQKQIAKARQSEVKSNLASLWSANESFRAEWTQYTGNFTMMKLSYSGQLRYNVGFGAVGAVPAGYTGAQNPAVANAGTYCPVSNGECTIINSNGTAPAAPAGAPGANTYTASGSAAIYNTTQDTWTITNAKVITNSVPGIP